MKKKEMQCRDLKEKEKEEEEEAKIGMSFNLSSQEFDDDGLPRRTGTLWTASSHIITAVIGSGVLSLAWAMAQLGWIVGPLTLTAFSLITYFTSTLLADCYRTADPIFGKRNYNYMSAVKSNLGKIQIYMCGICQYVNLCGTAIGYTITASISAAAIVKCHCYHEKGHDADCGVSYTIYMIGFGAIQILLSQFPNLHNISWLSAIAATMSFSYASIGIALSLMQTIKGSTGESTQTGTAVGVDVTQMEKIWNVFQALGNIAFAYSYATVLIEIQDTLRSSPPENKVMKKASAIGVSTTTVFYLLCGCLGYSAFGNKAPGNMLTGFGFYEPFWLIDIANICIVVHLLGAYQVFCQPVFAIVEDRVAKNWPNVKMLNKEILVVKSESFPLSLSMFRLVWRTVFVVICTLLAIIMPFFNVILGFLGSVAFWPLTVYFPIEMYMAQKRMAWSSPKAIMLRALSCLCLLVSLAAAIGSIEGIVSGLHKYKPFHTKS